MWKRLLVGSLMTIWVGFWFWAFSFAYTNSYFKYNHHSRIPTLVAALFAVSVVPVSTLVIWRMVVAGKRDAIAAISIHIVTMIVVLAVPFVVTHLLARAQRPWRLEADDAMGVGIDNMAVLVVATLSVIVLAVGLLVRGRRQAGARRGDA